MKQVFLSLGSNFGDKVGYINKALDLLSENSLISIKHKSSFYEAQPACYFEQGLFLNIVIKIETDLDPVGLLQEIQNIEDNLGVTRSIKSVPRKIDIDILLYEDEIINTKELEIPHLNLHLRPFVLIPLNEVAPEINHPIFFQTPLEMNEALTDVYEVRKLDLENLVLN